MIHYHGTPIGGKNTDAAEILRGRHGFISFARTEQTNIVLDSCQSFALDNGAFSAWKKTGQNVDFNGYVNWVSSLYRHPGFDWCLIPDVIDGTEEENTNLISKWIRIGLKAKSVPVWHMNESLEWLDWLVCNFEIVALGSSGKWSHPGTSAWWVRMSQAMGVCCDDAGRPKCRLHGLRMLDPAIFTLLPISSADSTNVGRNNNQISRFGMYPPPTAGQRASVIANRIESFNSVPVWTDINPQNEFNLA